MTASVITEPGVTTRDGVIALAGDITSRVTNGLMEAYDRVSRDRKAVRLDFSGANRMDVSGLNALIKLHERAKTRRVRLEATGLSLLFRDIFRASRLDEAIMPDPPGVTDRAGEAPAAGPWAAPVQRLRVKDVPEGAVSHNVDGLAVAGPVQGFGRLWEKTYRMRLTGVDADPSDVVRVWKEHFPELQPRDNRFFPTPSGIAPGEVVLINASTPAGPLYTGVQVLYADRESFAFITPQGHPEAGWVSFDACEEQGAIVVRVQGFARASDPLYELGFELMGSRMQEGIWRHVLVSLGRLFGVEGYVNLEKSCVGNDFQWERAGNVWYNAQIRSAGYALMRLAGL